ncbi:hypothetical protein [Candidatus Similichlamydia laticola]|uniref:hypothetical protein n=1 Tax=Candidatus Similichlamydia laticola TaxID=2170265 RepID=UPI0011C04843|nr:hypothetical protein [Candidatus Similichlamydia laticola]
MFLSSALLISSGVNDLVEGSLKRKWISLSRLLASTQSLRNRFTEFSSSFTWLAVLVKAWIAVVAFISLLSPVFGLGLGSACLLLAWALLYIWADLKYQDLQEGCQTCLSATIALLTVLIAIRFVLFLTVPLFPSP